MSRFLFSVIVDGVDAQDDDHVDLLVALDEVLLLADVDGTLEVHLEVEAATSEAALRAAVLLIESTAPGARVTRIDLDLVAASDIAERVGVSRQAVTSWVGTERRGLRFPAPVGRVAGGTRIWGWSQVLPWLQANGHGLDTEATLDHAAIVELNALLQRPRQPGRLATAGHWIRADLKQSRRVVPSQVVRPQERERLIVGDAALAA